MMKQCPYLFFFWVVLFWFIESIDAQNATTDPSEVRALNSIFQQWNPPAVNSWNISGEPCSGTALNQSDSVFEDPANNPSIRCDCSFNGGTVCHITRLKEINNKIRFNSIIRRVSSLSIQGVIPEELLNLPFLTVLKIDRNYLSGPLPAFIGNMSRLESLSIGTNVLSGPIPKELGNLKNLSLLSMSNNNFSGTLPPELGNLANLEQLDINSCGFSGEIPSTFANLTALQILWASDNAFTGRIPDFVGNNWTKLTSLRFEGNSFDGPIPSSLANLTSLTTLRIGDIYNGSSSLDFVRNLKNLTDLVLRNVMLNGILPSYIAELQSLQKLDLSFNNLTGQIPSTLFNMNSLIYLFLGNNSLSGSIPNQKSEALQTIDLSYNLLSGNLPSWVDTSLQLNLVANNFTLTSSNTVLLPGLECLQRSFQCSTNAPQYTNFSIKCGGTAVTSDGILFEADDSSLGAAGFNVTSTRKWAVSNVGLFADRQNQQYIENTRGQVRGTNSPALYQTSRLSPGSLRYYGLGLENGAYTVRLYFAETGFHDPTSQTWDSLVRRVFDVYIQGTRRLRDFDILQEAGGVLRAITRNFTIDVTENHLEIHLFWAGKGTSDTPEDGYYGSIISAISVVPNFRPIVNGPSGNSNNNRTALIAGVTVSVAALALILIAVIYVKRKREAEDEELLLGINPRPNTFTYSELKAATEDFSPSNKLGEGGFGPVYKGTLSDGRVVAVKQLSVASNQGKEQFVTEIATISGVQHRNLVKLHGCCIGGNRRILVYEYLVNNSLDQALWGKNKLHLDWTTRFNICLSTARGLAYLHEESSPRIVHRDVKATPEYAMRGHLSEKVDVFGFGVVALEIISGRPNSDSTLEDDRIYLLEWVWTLYEKNQLLSLLDPTLAKFDENQALRLIGVALLCTQASPSMRPSMSRVIAMLVEDIEVSTVKTKPSYLNYGNLEDITASTTFTNEESQTSIVSDSSYSGIE
ncbi:hypothetical protein V6N13_084287 [Hibiscus sabdariffa]